MKRPVLLIPLILTACASATPVATPRPLRVQYTFAAQTWLAEVADCAPQMPVVPELRAADYLGPGTTGANPEDPEDRDTGEGELAIRIGVPSPLLLPAYQIDSEDVLVVIHPQNPLASLTAEQARGLFSGAITNWREIGGADLAVRAWVFAGGEDLQQIFDSVLMGGTPVVSSARLAAGPEDMAATVGSDPGAIGLLTRHWVAGNVRVAYMVAAVPVIVLTAPDPDPDVQAVVKCLQE